MELVAVRAAETSGPAVGPGAAAGLAEGLLRLVPGLEAGPAAEAALPAGGTGRAAWRGALLRRRPGEAVEDVGNGSGMDEIVRRDTRVGNAGKRVAGDAAVPLAVCGRPPAAHVGVVAGAGAELRRGVFHRIGAVGALVQMQPAGRDEAVVGAIAVRGARNLAGAAGQVTHPKDLPRAVVERPALAPCDAVDGGDGKSELVRDRADRNAGGDGPADGGIALDEAAAGHDSPTRPAGRRGALRGGSRASGRRRRGPGGSATRSRRRSACGGAW